MMAYNLVLAADREMAYAMRSKFPVLSIEAVGQFRGGNINNLFENWAYTLAGNLVAPLIYGGRLSAEVDRTKAVKNQRLFEYGQAVLIAFQEVENALFREIKQAERLSVLNRQLDLAQKTSKQLRIEYLNGMSNYLDVLLALDEQQQLERELLETSRTGIKFVLAFTGPWQVPLIQIENQPLKKKIIMSTKKIVLICVGIIVVAVVITSFIFMTEPTAKNEGATKEMAMLGAIDRSKRREFCTFACRHRHSGTCRRCDH